MMVSACEQRKETETGGLITGVGGGDGRRRRRRELRRHRRPKTETKIANQTTLDGLGA